MACLPTLVLSLTLKFTAKHSWAHPQVRTLTSYLHTNYRLRTAEWDSRWSRLMPKGTGASLRIVWPSRLLSNIEKSDYASFCTFQLPQTEDYKYTSPDRKPIPLPQCGDALVALDLNQQNSNGRYKPWSELQMRSRSRSRDIRYFGLDTTGELRAKILREKKTIDDAQQARRHLKSIEEYHGICRILRIRKLFQKTRQQ